MADSNPGPTRARVSKPGRGKTLAEYAADFILMHRNLPHRSNDSVRVYRSVTSTFLLMCKAVYPEQITKEDVIGWHASLRAKYSDRTSALLYVAKRVL